MESMPTFYLLNIEVDLFRLAEVRTIVYIYDEAIIKKYVEMSKEILFFCFVI